MAAARRKAQGKMSDEEKTSRRLLRMEARKEEAKERRRKEAEMEKLMTFLARERAKVLLKDKGWKIKKELERHGKRAEEESRDAGKGVKRRRREAG